MKLTNIYILIYAFLFIIIPITSIDIFFPIVFDVIKLISVGIMSVYILIQYIKKRKIDKFDVIMLINAITLIVISIIKNTITYKNTFTIISLFVIPVFVKNILRESKQAMQSLYYVYVIIVLLNFITIFFRISLDEYQKIFFVGGKNAITMTIIPAMMIIEIYSLLKYNKLTKFNAILIGICIISLLASKSSTAIIISIIIILKIIISALKLNKIRMTFKKYAGIYLIAFIVIVVLFPMLKNTYFNTIFEQVFNKNLTFSQRDDLWLKSFEEIKESPIIGYGKDNNIIHNYTGGLLKESHNIIIETLLTGGIVYFVIFIIINIISAKGTNIDNEVSKEVVFYLFLYFIIGLMESIVFHYQLWMIFSIEYSINEIYKNYKEQNTDEKGIKINIEENNKL